MVAATGTFIDDMLTRAGFANVFAPQQRYPEITAEQLRRRLPMYCFYPRSLIHSRTST